MIIKPRTRGPLCVTAHPEGCKRHVQEQIAYLNTQPKLPGGPRRVLVLGASTGYGLAARLTSAVSCGAATLGVFFEKPGTDKKTASAGWYNSAAFHQLCPQDTDLPSASINGDAFSEALKARCVAWVKEHWGQIDLIIYSLAAPRRTHPDTGVVHTSALKPIGQELQTQTINTDKVCLQECHLSAATPEEIEDTVAVMGGDDWLRWITTLNREHLLAPGAKTTAFTYLGDQVTWAIYWEGTIGAAKKDLDKKVHAIRAIMKEHGGDAWVSVLKAVVTQASSAIPIMPLYLSLLLRFMKENGSHEDCIQQIHRLFAEGLYSNTPRLDEEGRLRMDEREMDPAIQNAVLKAWPMITTENMQQQTDFAGYQSDFLKLFGFGLPGGYEADDVDPEVPIPNLITL